MKTEYHKTRRTMGTMAGEQSGGGGGGADARRLMEDAKALYLRRFPQPEGDDLVVEAVLGTVLASRFNGPPVWLIDVTRPSGGKTTILEPLYDMDGSYFTSGLSDKTLASGLSKKDAEGNLEPALLERFKTDGTRLLIVKDFGSIQEMRPDTKKELLQQFREVYDGDYRKPYGTGKVIEWRGHLGFLAAATPKLDNDYLLIASLGQRFIYFRRSRSTLDTDRAMAYHAINSDVSAEDVRYELGAAFWDAIQAASDPCQVDVLPAQQEAIVAATLAATRWRTPVARNSRHMVAYAPDPEGPGRIIKELKMLAQSVAALYGRTAVGPHEIRLVQRIAHDSMPQRRADILEALATAPSLSTSELLGAVCVHGYSAGIIKEDLEDLETATIGVVKKVGGGRGVEAKWRGVQEFIVPLVEWKS